MKIWGCFARGGGVGRKREGRKSSKCNTKIMEHFGR